MDPVYFHSWWNVNDGRLSHVGTKHNIFSDGTERALFGDGGLRGGIYVRRSTNDFDLNFQNNLKVLFIENSFPKYCKYNDIEMLTETTYHKNEHLFIAKREATLNKYRHHQLIADAVYNKKTRKNVNFFINSAFNDASVTKLKKLYKVLPRGLAYAADKYSLLLTNAKIKDSCKTSSAMYSGGCIKTFFLASRIFIARCVGPYLDTLSIDHYHTDKETLERVFTLPSDVTNDPIFEIDSMMVSDECRLLVRRLNSMKLFEVSWQDNNLSVREMGVLGGQPEYCISGKQSDKNKNELAVVSGSKMMLYDVKTLVPKWDTIIDPLPPVVDSWTEVTPYLPNQWLVANRAECRLFDSRDTQVKVIELFSTKCKTLNRHESFSHLSTIFNDHYFYIFSSFNGNLIDVRVPGKQINQWTLPLLNPVSYSSINESSLSNTLNFVVGSQMESRHCIFNQTRSQIKSTALKSRDPSEGDLPMSLGLASVYDDHYDLTNVFTISHQGGKVLRHQYRSSLSSESADKGSPPESIDEPTLHTPIKGDLDYSIFKDYISDKKNHMKVLSTEQLETDWKAFETTYMGDDSFNI